MEEQITGFECTKFNWFADTELDKFYQSGLKYVDWQINRAGRKWN
jgi:hypothetical protein